MEKVTVTGINLVIIWSILIRNYATKVRILVNSQTEAFYTSYFSEDQFHFEVATYEARTLTRYYKRKFYSRN